LLILIGLIEIKNKNKQKYNGKIGTLDLETLTLNKGPKDSTVGEQSVYAGGWALN